MSETSAMVPVEFFPSDVNDQNASFPSTFVPMMASSSYAPFTKSQRAVNWTRVPPRIGVKVRVQLTGPIGVVASAFHWPISGARTPSFPLPRFQRDAFFATIFSPFHLDRIAIARTSQY